MTSPERSAIMRAVKSRDTSPERAVRKLLTAMGYRYRLHSKKLPGAPDIVFPSLEKSDLRSWLLLAWPFVQARRADP